MSDTDSQLSRPSSELDPLRHPELYEGLIFRRGMAYLMDVVIVACLVGIVSVASLILGVMTFGLSFGVTGLLLQLIPFAYYAMIIGGPRHATMGMRTMNLKVRIWSSGISPELPQALILNLLFYASIALTAWLIVLVAFFSDSRRCLHDYFSGTVAVNKLAGGIESSAAACTDISIREKPGVPE
ncbi:MAG: RDD family protein [Rhodospirillaceae bacterium]